MPDLPCGCQIIYDECRPAIIKFCPLHEAALDLREACEEMAKFLYGWAESPERVDAHYYLMFKNKYENDQIHIGEILYF